MLLELLKDLEELSILSNKLVFAQVSYVAHRIKQCEQLKQLIYIYELECLYETFVFHLNSFLEYYSLFIDFYKMYNSDLYFTSALLSEVLNQHNFLNTILLYFTLKALCSHFI